jgi:hypothetical protein
MFDLISLYGNGVLSGAFQMMLLMLSSNYTIIEEAPLQAENEKCRPGRFAAMIELQEAVGA